MYRMWISIAEHSAVPGKVLLLKDMLVVEDHCPDSGSLVICFWLCRVQRVSYIEFHKRYEYIDRALKKNIDWKCVIKVKMCVPDGEGITGGCYQLRSEDCIIQVGEIKRCEMGGTCSSGDTGDKIHENSVARQREVGL
jgi:hypothetical protein